MDLAKATIEILGGSTAYILKCGEKNCPGESCEVCRTKVKIEESDAHNPS